MKYVFKKLTDNELSELEQFFSEHAKDNHSLSLSTVYGMFCAIFCAPHLISPSLWKPIIFGEHPSKVNNNEYHKIFSFTAMLGNEVNDQLRKNSRPQLLLWNGKQRIPLKICSDQMITQWCEGYLIGYQLDPMWLSDQNSLDMLLPFRALSNQVNLTGNKYKNSAIIQDDKPLKIYFKDNINKFVKEISSYWMHERRKAIPLGDGVMVAKEINDEITMEHNNICSCGSGKKFTTCCGLKNLH